MRFFYYNNELQETYPTKIVKKIRQNIYSIESHERIHRVWNDHGKEIDTELSIKLSGTGMCKINAYDTTSTNEKAFRMKLINRILPTLDLVKRLYKMIENDTCKRCNKFQETLEHLFTCKKTVESIPTLENEFHQLLTTRINESTDYKHLRSLKNQPKLEELSSIISIKNPDFLNSVISKGIISKTFYESTQSQSPIKKHFKQWFLYTIDCWLSIVYRFIWITRNDLTIPKNFNKRIARKQRKMNSKGNETPIKLRPSPTKLSPSGNHYKVEAILDSREDPNDDNNTEYLIHWKGYNMPTDHSWVKFKTISHLKHLIRKFERQRTQENDLSTPTKRQKIINLIPLQSPKTRKRPRISNIIPETQTNFQPVYESEPEYEIEMICDHYFDSKRDTIYYETKWKGYPDSQNSWLPEQNFNNALETLNIYKNIHNLNKRTTRSKSKKNETSENNPKSENSKEPDHRKRKRKRK